MFLLIFESIGTSELILIGIVALIFLGPRKMPEIARKIGKMMADFRNTTNEFKTTWEREVNFDEEEKAIRTGDLPSEPVARINPASDAREAVVLPEIRAVDPDEFKSISPQKQPGESDDENTDKRDWL